MVHFDVCAVISVRGCTSLGTSAETGATSEDTTCRDSLTAVQPGRFSGSCAGSYAGSYAICDMLGISKSVPASSSSGCGKMHRLLRAAQLVAHLLRKGAAHLSAGTVECRGVQLHHCFHIRFTSSVRAIVLVAEKEIMMISMRWVTMQ